MGNIGAFVYIALLMLKLFLMCIFLRDVALLLCHCSCAFRFASLNQTSSLLFELILNHITKEEGSGAIYIKYNQYMNSKNKEN